MKRAFFSLILVAAGVSAAVVATALLRSVWPAWGPPPGNIAQHPPEFSEGDMPSAGGADIPLRVPSGFSISIFATDLPGARVMARDPFGNFWVSQTKEGIISLVEVKDREVPVAQPVLTGLRNPHGLAFDPENPFVLYYAEEHRISRLPTYSDGGPEKIADLPSGEQHVTRTLGFGSDERLYVSIGSTCDVCYEGDPRHAAIVSMKKDGSDMKIFARGLRNSVFFTWHYVTGELWATEMGRDWLGDHLPPDEINIVREGGHYGWPLCYGKNVVDRDFHRDDHVHIRSDCSEPFELPSRIDIPAHSAPLGLAFIPEEGWPEEYWYDLLVAYHGSWNRTAPAGYAVTRFKLDPHGQYEGEEDFVTGWFQGGAALGRPVHLLAYPGGVAYLSDDKAGVIYKISRTSSGL